MGQIYGYDQQGKPGRQLIYRSEVKGTFGKNVANNK